MANINVTFSVDTELESKINATVTGGTGMYKYEWTVIDSPQPFHQIFQGADKSSVILIDRFDSFSLNNYGGGPRVSKLNLKITSGVTKNFVYEFSTPGYLPILLNYNRPVTGSYCGACNCQRFSIEFVGTDFLDDPDIFPKYTDLENLCSMDAYAHPTEDQIVENVGPGRNPNLNEFLLAYTTGNSYGWRENGEQMGDLTTQFRYLRDDFLKDTNEIVLYDTAQKDPFYCRPFDQVLKDYIDNLKNNLNREQLIEYAKRTAFFKTKIKKINGILGVLPQDMIYTWNKQFGEDWIWSYTEYYGKSLNDILGPDPQWKYIKTVYEWSDVPQVGQIGHIIYVVQNIEHPDGYPSGYYEENRYTWNPLENKWDSRLMDAVIDVDTQRRAKRDAHLKAFNEMFLSTNPLIWSTIWPLHKIR